MLKFNLALKAALYFTVAGVVVIGSHYVQPREMIGAVHIVYPNPKLTPGITNPAVTQATIQATICKAGWTGTVRPSTTYTNNLKLVQLRQYGFTGKPSEYEEDHLLSLEIGGSPIDPGNLWPQPYAFPGAREKDVVEGWLKREVCAGRMTLAAAQHTILADWYRIYVRIKGNVGSVGEPDRDDD